MAELRADSQKRTGRLSVYLAYSAAAHVLGTVVLFGATGVVPSTAAAEHVLTALLMFAGSIVVPDGTEAMWAFCMMRQGAASSGGQQPSTP